MVVKDSSPQNRRDLVDDLGHRDFSKIFYKFLKKPKSFCGKKNALLKQIRDGNIDKSNGHRLFHSITDLFFAKSARMVSHRLEVMEILGPRLQEEFSAIMGDSLVEIDMDYLISGESAVGKSAEEVVNAMYKRWQELKTQECQLGQSLVGPHKHDVQFLFNGQEARIFCSQGQQRAIILAFKIAHIRLHCSAHGIYPMLLLDDVLSELDRKKQDRFLEYLLSTESQILLTTTDASRIPSRAVGSVFDVNVGTFAKREDSLTGGVIV